MLVERAVLSSSKGRIQFELGYILRPIPSSRSLLRHLGLLVCPGKLCLLLLLIRYSTVGKFQLRTIPVGGGGRANHEERTLQHWENAGLEFGKRSFSSVMGRGLLNVGLS